MNKNCTLLFHLLDQYIQNHPNKTMLHAKKNLKWEGMLASEVKVKAYQLAIAIKKLGLGPHDYTDEGMSKIGIIANNRPEWIITDYATQYAGCILVPIYPSITASEWAYIINESQIKVLFISDKSIYKKIQSVKDQLPSLTHIYSFDEIPDVPHWTSVVEPIHETEKAEIDTIKDSLKPQHLATIIYTSGTTGNPKGVMLTHQNIMSNIEGSMPAFNFCNSNERILSFLPLNHIFERTVMNIYINKQVSIYFAEGMETIGPDMMDVKPVVITTVPRLLEKVYEKIELKGSQLNGFKKNIFDWAVALASEFNLEKQSLSYKIKLAIADKLVYTKWRQAIGGNIKAIVTGSAACQVRLLKLFTAAKIVVMEGYGLTETSPVISVNRYEAINRKFGTIGTVIDNVKVKLGADGEIICQGPNIMKGYYKHPELTDEVIKDSWFHTGDIGEFIDGKFLKLTDRNKEIFKISGGKYIAPLPIENKMKESHFIEQIMVVGNNEKFAGALIVPSIQKIREFFSDKNIELASDIDLTTDKDVLRLIRKELDQFNQLFAAHEQIKKFKLLLNEWTIETGELTATMKLRRKKIAEKYADVIASIYS
ncbi:MAG: long-chain fatty acid--CoA ligase [Chitinophagaceae bacterium]